MSKKTKGLILIIIGILIALFGVFLLNSREINKQVLPVEITAEKISTEISVYDFMTQLQNEGKINFKEKTYTGMGKFIEEINGIKNGEKNWIYYVNGQKAEIGVSNYKINNGDIVSWKYEAY